jgi:hypothetical protein
MMQLFAAVLAGRKAVLNGTGAFLAQEAFILDQAVRMCCCMRT